MTEDGTAVAEENDETLESHSVCLVAMFYLKARREVPGVSNKLSWKESQMLSLAKGDFYLISQAIVCYVAMLWVGFDRYRYNDTDTDTDIYLPMSFKPIPIPILTFHFISNRYQY